MKNVGVKIAMIEMYEKYEKKHKDIDGISFGLCNIYDSNDAHGKCEFWT